MAWCQGTPDLFQPLKELIIPILQQQINDFFIFIKWFFLILFSLSPLFLYFLHLSVNVTPQSDEL